MPRVSRIKEHLPLEEVQRRHRQEKRPAQRRRWLIVLSLQADPRLAAEVARQLDCSRSLVSQTVAAYNRGGPAALEPPAPRADARQRPQRRAYLSAEEEAALLAPFAERAARGQIVTARPVRLALEARLGHGVDARTAERLLARQHWRKLVPRPQHPDADLAAQETHKKKLPEQVAAAVSARAGWTQEDTRPLILMAQDEGRFGRISEVRRAWAPPGVRPICPRQIVRESLYVFAAVAPLSGELSALILPRGDPEAMNLFLATLAADFVGRRVVLPLDGAGWHRSAQLALPENVALCFQPPRSPELNPAEHLWEDLRENATANLAFDSLDEVQDALCQRLRQLHTSPAIVQSMTSFPWFKLQN
jgi:transposase